ncbi:MAG: DNA-directed RNA polymerase specialized sigma24 family protein [Verrucomicrobiales bacterium]|jgi:DNA-directed RNA polymerase specialized sigma24 family protein
MDAEIPITHWLKEAEIGDEAARQRIWEFYYKRLVGLARTKLREGSKRIADEDDAVIAAFDAFFRGAEEGRFPELNDRGDLWQILVMLTCRKSSDQMKYQDRQRRGQGNVRGESIFLRPSGEESSAGFDEFEGADATPEFALEVAENYQQLLAKLGDDNLRQIAVWKMEGLQNTEIAECLETTTRTVERKLNLIRQHWADEV